MTALKGVRTSFVAAVSKKEGVVPTRAMQPIPEEQKSVVKAARDAFAAAFCFAESLSTKAEMARIVPKPTGWGRDHVQT